MKKLVLFAGIYHTGKRKYVKGGQEVASGERPGQPKKVLNRLIISISVNSGKQPVEKKLLAFSC